MTMCEFCGVDYVGDSYKAKNKHLRNECKKNPYAIGSGFNAPIKPKKMLDKVGIHVLSDRPSANRRESQTSATSATIRQTTNTPNLTSVSATSATSANTVAKTHPPSAIPIRGADGGVMVSPPNLAVGIKPIKLRDFKPQNPKSWIVQDILGAGTLAVLGGKRATFKSTISVSLAARVAAGLPFLGHHCDKVPVLYMDEENGDAHLYDLFTNTVKPLGAEFEPPCLDNVQIICGQGVSRLWDTMAALDPESPDCPKLIIMDGLRRFLGTANENDAGEVSKFMQTAKYEAERLGACILFLHHARKSQNNGGKQTFDEFEDAMDSLRGSSDIMASVSTAMITTRVGDSTKVMVSFPKTRWGKEPPPVGIEFMIDDDAIQLTLTGEDNQTDFVMTQNAQIIRSWAIKGQHDVFTSEQVKNGLTGRLGIRTIERVLPWMLDAGWIRKQKKGVYEFDLPASGQQQIG